MKLNIHFFLEKRGDDVLSDKKTLSEIFKQFSIFINKKFSSKTSFLIFFAVYLLSIFSLLRNSIDYKDDIVRTLTGMSGWLDFSRYSSEYLSHILHANKNFLADISPIPQIIAVIELSLASLYLLKGITGKRRFSIFQLAATLPLGLNPYFIECLSFKYDSPYMALSILCAVVPLIFIKHTVLFFISILVCTIIICTSYQVSIGILPMTVIFTLMSLYTKGESLKYILKAATLLAVSFTTGLIIFKFLIMLPVPYVYVSDSIPPLNMLPNIFIEHMKIYFASVSQDFSISLRNKVMLVCVLFLILSVFHSKNNKLITFFLSLVTLILGAILTFAFYAILEKPLYIPRALYGIGGFIACVFIFCVSLKDLYITKICSFILAWSFIVLASAYGNALVAQSDWEDFRIQEVIYDIATIENQGNSFKYHVKGSSGLAPKTSYLRNAYPVLNKLIPVNYCGNIEIGTWKFERYYGLKNLTKDESITDTGNPQIVKETMYHQIKVFDDKVLITLK